MEGPTLIRVIAGLLFVFVFLGIGLGYIFTLTSALNKCSVASRTLQPGTVWLLLIPFFNLIWNFFVVIGMANTLGNEFRARGVTQIDPEPGKSLGLAMCICGACSIIPLLGLLIAPVYLVLWIIYWVKITGFSRVLDIHTVPVAPYNTPTNF
jgi:hypothetical protein